MLAGAADDQLAFARPQPDRRGRGRSSKEDGVRRRQQGESGGRGGRKELVRSPDREKEPVAEHARPPGGEARPARQLGERRPGGAVVGRGDPHGGLVRGRVGGLPEGRDHPQLAAEDEELGLARVEAVDADPCGFTPGFAQIRRAHDEDLRAGIARPAAGVPENSEDRSGESQRVSPGIVLPVVHHRHRVGDELRLGDAPIRLDGAASAVARVAGVARARSSASRGKDRESGESGAHGQVLTGRGAPRQTVRCRTAVTFFRPLFRGPIP